MTSVQNGIKNENSFAGRYILHGVFPYLWLGFLIFCAYTFILPQIHDNDIKKVQFYMAVFLTAAAVYFLTAYYFKKLSFQNAVLVLLFMGFILRLGYALYTPLGVRQHDLGGIDGNGHLGYVYYIYKNMALPNNYDSQFYHPPLHHFIAGMWLKINVSLLKVSENLALNGIKMLTVFYSSAMMIASAKLFKAIKLSNKAVIIALAVICLHPAFIISAGSINNDTLMLMFFTFALLYTVKWYKNPTMKNIIILGIFIGCAMMTKLSGVLIAPVTAAVFLLKLIRSSDNKKTASILKQFLAFIGVSFPLGLWHPIRNLLLFKQPIGYVMRISETEPIYCGDKSFFERFLSFPIQNMLNPIYCRPEDDYNLPLYVLKCSMFGEFDYYDADFQARILIIVNLLMIILSVAAMIYVLTRKDRQNAAVFSMVFLINIMVQLVSFLQFNISYPFGCTMDFRYIYPTVISGAAFIALAADMLREKNLKLYRNIETPVLLLIGFFMFSSAWFFVSLT